VLASLAPTGQQLPAGGQATAELEEEGHSKSNPFPATVLENRNLNGPGEKQTHQIAFSLEGSGLEYEVGDALGVYPLNPPDIVDEILANLPFKPADVPGRDGAEVPLREALIGHYDIGLLNKALVQKWQERSGSPFLRSLVAADDKAAWDDFCRGRELIDLVIDHPADFSDAEDFVSVLKKLQPRLYSIASSPRAHPGEVHLCVGIVRYQTHGRKRGGVCSTFFADRLGGGVKPGVYVHSNPAFRLPADGNVPVIMAGPGTGIAPFRAFLEDRRATGAKGKNWLFFGNHYRATDFLYEDEINGYLADGTLARLDVAWSRDQKEKLYVQHLMMQQGAELWSWLKDGAAFYVCGDASRMAKDVDQALHAVAKEHGKLSEEEASAFINQLKKEKRYLRDVY
jgi:sulfite reductase (NADPH) flavoprotein alpha-component